MSTNRIRLSAAAGTTLALVLAGASVVTAQTPDQTAWGDGPGAGIMHGPRGGFGGPGGGFGGPGFGGRGGERGFRGMDRAEGILEQHQQLVRQELTLDLGEDGGIVTQRVEHGTVTEVADGSLTFTLATGETVTVATDGDTDAYALDPEQRPFREEVDVAAITVGADVMVWSQSQEDGGYLASHVTVLPDMTTDGITPEESPAAVG